MADYKNNVTRYLVNFIGSLLLIIGVIAALYAPLEIYCYYLFTEGGTFHYEGFGFGSLMFGNITLQIIGYYLIAIVFIPLGYGHLKKRIWIQNISLTLLRVWLIIGLPILPMVFFIFVSTKEPSITVGILAAIFCVLIYSLIPFLLIRFYKSERLTSVLIKLDGERSIIQNYSVSILVLITLYAFYILVFHELLLFRGIFPLFGKWLTELNGVMVISSSIIFFVILILGTLNFKLWAWWAAILYFVFFTISLIATFLSSDLIQIITILKLPQKEIDAIRNVPLNGIHLSMFFGIPLFLTFCTIIISRKYFTKKLN
ncbi:MAG: hypothetical protein V1720_06920 [bacterium]